MARIPISGDFGIGKSSPCEIGLTAHDKSGYSIVLEVIPFMFVREK